jgi:hypothetical protein
MIGPYKLPVGVAVWVQGHAVHRSPHNYTRPDDFWPERWDLKVAIHRRVSRRHLRTDANDEIVPGSAFPPNRNRMLWTRSTPTPLPRAIARTGSRATFHLVTGRVAAPVSPWPWRRRGAPFVCPACAAASH